jgi:hypothetical protein
MSNPCRIERIPSRWREMVWLGLRVFAASVAKISTERSQCAADGGRPSPRPEALRLPPGTGQFCQTNPNWRGPMRLTSAFEEKGYGNLRQSPGWEKQSQTREGRDVWVRVSRAGWPRQRMECAKRTQCVAARITQCSTILLFHHSSPLPTMRYQPKSKARTDRSRFHCSRIPSSHWARLPGAGYSISLMISWRSLGVSTGGLLNSPWRSLR